MSRPRHLSGAVLALAAGALLTGAGTGGARPAASPPARDDTAVLQARLDAGGGRLYLPKLPGGACYATRGLWVSHDDTQIVSNGACVTSLGPGPVRLTSPDGDPIPASAVFFVNHSQPLEPAPARISISGLRIVVPAIAGTFGLGIFGHEVTIRDVTVTGSPIDAVTIGGRANGDGYAGRVALLDSRFSGGTRNVVSATAVVGLRIERCRITGATDAFAAAGQPGGNPAAGIDLEPDSRGAPALDVRIAGNLIADNAGPGVIVSLETRHGLPVTATGIELVGNRILRNSRKTTPPQRGGIVFNGGQDRGGGRALVSDNVVTGNRGAGLQGKAMTLVVDSRRNDLRGNELGPSLGIRFARRAG